MNNDEWDVSSKNKIKKNKKKSKREELKPWIYESEAG